MVLAGFGVWLNSAFTAITTLCSGRKYTVVYDLPNCGVAFGDEHFATQADASGIYNLMRNIGGAVGWLTHP